jgi:hypothetical protein
MLRMATSRRTHRREAHPITGVPDAAEEAHSDVQVFDLFLLSEARSGEFRLAVFDSEIVRKNGPTFLVGNGSWADFIGGTCA